MKDRSRGALRDVGRFSARRRTEIDYLRGFITARSPGGRGLGMRPGCPLGGGRIVETDPKAELDANGSPA